MGFIEELRREVELKDQEREVRQELLNQRVQAAMAFRQESGVGTLVAEFVHLINKREYQKSVGRRVTYSPLADFRFCHMLGVDDGVIDLLQWDFVRAGPGDIWGATRNKLLVVQVLPDGNITFHGDKKVSIGKVEWRKNTDVLENGLVQTFNNPATTLRRLNE